MIHWYFSMCLGFLVSGRARPLCSIIYCAPNCLARRAFMAWADWYFKELQHCRRMHLIYLAGRHLI